MQDPERSTEVPVSTASPPPPSLHPAPAPVALHVRLRPVIIALVMAGGLAFRRGAAVDSSAPNRSAALVEVLRGRGLACDEGDVTWIKGPNGVRGAMFGGSRALVRASLRDEPSDLYLVATRLSPEGVLLGVGAASNVTRTIGVDESRPVLHGNLAAYTTTLDGTATGVHTLDLTGRAPATYTDFTRTQRWQTALTNVQQTGQPYGVVHNAFALDPNAAKVVLSFRDDGLLDITADDRKIVVDPALGKTVEGGGWVREVPEERARPGNLVTWSVDRVRAMPWFGDDNMQWLKAIAFTGLDYGLRARAFFVQDTSAHDVAEDLGGANVTQAPVFIDPEIGWPPPPLKPILSPPLPGEGQWITLDKDPFITLPPGLPSPFVTTYLRTDKDRRDTRIYMTMWDPRVIALHMVAGTVEPVSATGEAGPGVIPRAPEVMKRVVAGFNGGFQAMHGEYGMQADGVLYLPPKPYAATVIELRDGTTGFGAWPRSTEVPDEVLSFRQNLTALVQNDHFNPWGRVWWGGTPPGWADTIHTTRSGLCLTKENFVAYFFGNEISAEVLASAMLGARCAFGIHFDMNPGLVGFEFYNVQPTATFAPLGRPLQNDWEYQGALKDFAGFSVHARRMIRSMQEINFPQYIHREGRDFFYLTVRPTLPGSDLAPPVAPPEANEGAWRVKGLPQHGFPYAVATTSLRIDPSQPQTHARVLRIDPRVVRAAGSAGTSETTPTVVSLFTAQRPPRGAEVGVWLGSGVFLEGVQPPSADASLLLVGQPAAAFLASPGAESPRVAVGIHDEDGMLEWVELAPDATADASSSRAMDALLAHDGCGTRLFVLGAARALLGGSLELDGSKGSPPVGTSARLVRGAAPAARPYFESTPIVTPSVWQPLQSQRVRYFPKPRSAAPASTSGASPAGSANPTPPAAGSSVPAGGLGNPPNPTGATLE